MVWIGRVTGKWGLRLSFARAARGDNRVEIAGRHGDHRVMPWISPSTVLRSLGSSWRSVCTLSTACRTVV